MTKKKIVVFSGAGLDRESGILTFRDTKDGMWNNYKIDEVATPQGWVKDRSKVLDFYNERRRQLPEVTPNDAHIALAKLEEEFDIIHVTQNVSDLLERGGSTNIIHLHGELTKARTSFSMNNPRLVASQHVYNIGYNDIKLGDLDAEYEAQLRPHIVWFDEYPFGVDKAYHAFRNADIVLIIGTSLEIGYTLSFFGETKKDTPIIYIDPKPSKTLDFDYPGIKIEYITKTAVDGVREVVNRLLIKKED